MKQCYVGLNGRENQNTGLQMKNCFSLLKSTLLGFTPGPTKQFTAQVLVCNPTWGFLLFQDPHRPGTSPSPSAHSDRLLLSCRDQGKGRSQGAALTPKGAFSSSRLIPQTLQSGMSWTAMHHIDWLHHPIDVDISKITLHSTPIPSLPCGLAFTHHISDGSRH